MQKDAVDDQRRGRFRLLGIQIERLVIVEIELFRNVVAGTVGAQGPEQQPAERIVIIGIEIEPVRRIPAARIAKISRIVKVVHRCADHGPALRGHQWRQRIRQCRLARAIDAIDGNTNSSIRMKISNGPGEAGKVTLLPHMGSATIEGRVEMGEKVIINIRTFLDNHKPPDRVLPSML